MLVLNAIVTLYDGRMSRFALRFCIVCLPDNAALGLCARKDRNALTSQKFCLLTTDHDITDTVLGKRQSR